MKKLVILFFVILSIKTVAQDKEETINDVLDSIQIPAYYKQNSLRKIPKTIHVINIDKAKNKSIQSIDDVLKLVSGIDVRSRGSKSVQSDLSLRGGSFEQVLILLNGVPVNNPQTGHHHTDLPIDFSMLKKIEVIEGASAQAFGVDSYSGVINLVTKNPDINKANAHFSAGQFGYIKTDMNISHSLDNISVYNGFSFQKSNGYLADKNINNTDFFSIKDFIHIKIKTSKKPINIQAGYHQKNFGANSFYTSKYPWQYEKTRGYFAQINTEFGKKIVIKPVISYKLHYDQFQLFRESEYRFNNGFFIRENDTAQYAPGFYYKGHNNHKTSVLSTRLLIMFNSKLGKTNMLASAIGNMLYSNVLGKELSSPVASGERLPYTKSDRRFYAKFALNQVKKIGKFHLGASVNMLYSKKYQTQFSGGVYLNFVNPVFTYYASINKAVRLPSFTDLYYVGPANIGNPNLQPENAISFELGSKYRNKNIFGGISFFYRQGNHTIDWIKYNPADKWKPENLTSLLTWGLEMDFNWSFEHYFIEDISLSLANINMKKPTTNFISKYALDYVKHKIVLGLKHKLFYGVQTNWTFLYKNRNGQYIDYVDNSYQLFNYKPYFLTNVKLHKTFDKFDLGISVENVFDISYQDLSFVKMPGRWLIVDLNYIIK